MNSLSDLQRSLIEKQYPFDTKLSGEKEDETLEIDMKLFTYHCSWYLLVFERGACLVTGQFQGSFYDAKYDELLMDDIFDLGSLETHLIDRVIVVNYFLQLIETINRVWLEIITYELSRWELIIKLSDQTYSLCPYDSRLYQTVRGRQCPTEITLNYEIKEINNLIEYLIRNSNLMRPLLRQEYLELPENEESLANVVIRIINQETELRLVKEPLPQGDCSLM